LVDRLLRRAGHDPAGWFGIVTLLAVVGPVRLYRDGLVALFREQAGFEVAAAVASEDGLACVREFRPDVVLVALGPGVGASFVRELRVEAPATRVVMVGIADDDPEVLPLAEAGVAGYVTTEASADDVVRTVEGVLRGQSPCSPALAARLLERVAILARDRQTTGPLDPLTSREQEVAELIGDGLSNKEIARRLQIEVPTVKNHVHNVLSKLSVERRGQIAALLRR
jgi:DNA-binding NarL/FixJ family response regulator